MKSEMVTLAGAFMTDRGTDGRPVVVLRGDAPAWVRRAVEGMDLSMVRRAAQALKGHGDVVGLDREIVARLVDSDEAALLRWVLDDCRARVAQVDAANVGIGVGGVWNGLSSQIERGQRDAYEFVVLRLVRVCRDEAARVMGMA
jgi:hypothetical protein